MLSSCNIIVPTRFPIKSLTLSTTIARTAIVTGSGGAATAASVALVPALAGLAFTGSHAAGTQLASVAARRCVPAVLELGGKDKVYVHSDVGDLRHVAATISDAAYVNGGQTCCAPRLVFAHEAVADELALRLEDRVCGYKIGDPAEASTFMGEVP